LGMRRSIGESLEKAVVPFSLREKVALAPDEGCSKG
jgi:hypothetical protein